MLDAVQDGLRIDFLSILILCIQKKSNIMALNLKKKCFIYLIVDQQT